MTDDYEVMSSRRHIEDARRGYSVGGGGGFVASVDYREVAIAQPVPRAAIPQVFEGYACRYDVIHDHKGRKEMFAKGCFNGSLFGVMLHIDHNLLLKKLGDQDDGNLELIDSDIALAFRLKLAPGDLDRLGGRNEMSVRYQEREVETRQIGGDAVRVIKSASLFEISAVYVGAVRKTFAIVRDASVSWFVQRRCQGRVSERGCIRRIAARDAWSPTCFVMMGLKGL
jgi:phage head maturation protease